MNFGWELEQKAWDFGDKTAIINPDESKINYRDLNNLSNQMGNVLKQQGIKKGDVVSTLLPDGYEYVAFVVGAWKIGAITAPLNRAAEVKRWKEMLSATGAKLLIANVKFLDATEKLLNETSLNKVIIQGDGKTGYDHIEKLLQESSPEFKIVPCRESDPANITFTGGTTGISKAAVATHGMLRYTSRKCQMLLGTCSKDTAIMPIATYHTGGISMIGIGIVAGSRHILLGDWSADRFIYLMKKYKHRFSRSYNRHLRTRF